MKKLILLMSMVMAMMSCNSAGGGEKYTLEGTIKNGANKTVYLEQLSLQKITVIDTALTDGSGKFRLSGTAEKGFYRVRMDNAHMWLMLLENKTYRAELNYNDPNDAKITGTATNDDFQAAVKYATATQMKMQSEKGNYQQLQAGGASPEALQKLATEADSIQGKFESDMKAKAAASKDALLAFYYTSFLRMDKYPKENQEIVTRLQKEMPNSSYTKEMTTQYAAMQQQIKAQEQAQKSEGATNIGSIAPDLAFTSPDGKVLKLSDLRGQVVLLDFWASWCRPCRMENPNVVAAYKKFKDKGFTIYSVSLDQDATRWKGAIEQDGLVWPNHVSDLKGWQSEAARIYGVQGIPAQFLLDKTGKIIAKNLRGEQLEQALTDILK